MVISDYEVSSRTSAWEVGGTRSEGIVKLGKNVVGVEFGDEGVIIVFRDESRLLADIAVGADGLRSVRSDKVITWVPD